MKRYVSAILINVLLINLYGCYSMEQLTKDYSSGDDITRVLIKTKAGESYTFEKFNSLDQLIKSPTESFFTDYSFQDSSMIIVSKRINTESSYKDKLFILTDTLVYNMNQLQSINCEQYHSEQTQLLVGGILLVGLIAVIAIAMRDFHPLGSGKMKLF